MVFGFHQRRLDSRMRSKQSDQNDLTAANFVAFREGLVASHGSWPVAGPSRDAFLAAMRHVAASVTVVTTDGGAGLAGATVSAFCSVSADPPTVLVCLRAESRIGRAVADNGVFTVSVLPEDKADIAHRFAGGLDDTGADRFAGVALAQIPENAPGILGTTAFACRLIRTIRESTHLMCIGEVRKVLPGPATPLAYLAGAYCRVTPKLHAVAS